MRTYLQDGLFLAGVGLIVSGCHMIYPPLAYLIGGVGLCVVGLALNRVK